MLLKGMTDLLLIFSTFFCPIWIKFDRGDVHKNLVSNFFIKSGIVKTVLYLGALMNFYL